MELLDIPVKRADGHETTLSEYSGKVILVVNVASKCGLTRQYEGLQRLYSENRDAGLVIAAFPANDFKGQEPGSDAEIVAFCTSTYDVQFPIFSKIAVTGDEKHPLYKQLIALSPRRSATGQCARCYRPAAFQLVSTATSFGISRSFFLAVMARSRRDLLRM
jgi:glutathione peroxidase